MRRFGHTMRGMGVRHLLAAAVVVAVAAALAATAAARPATQPKPKSKPTPSSSASAQYGRKVAVCAVTTTGRQHTIELPSKSVPAYIAAHPATHVGACAKPRKAKNNVCIRLTRTKLAPVYVPPKQLRAYLKRNHGSYRTTTGKCTRRTA